MINGVSSSSALFGLVGIVIVRLVGHRLRCPVLPEVGIFVFECDILLEGYFSSLAFSACELEICN